MAKFGVKESNYAYEWQNKKRIYLDGRIKTIFQIIIFLKLMAKQYRMSSKSRKNLLIKIQLNFSNFI